MCNGAYRIAQERVARPRIARMDRKVQITQGRIGKDAKLA